MPRQGRLHIPEGYYHVMGRGLERRRIFSSDEDKKDFLERLGVGLEQTHCQCLAFAVMSNHYHLLIQVSAEPLSRLMSKLLSGYATHYNYRKKRSGYVFQNRYKSILCDADQYLLELIRYIHLNPLKANMVESMAKLDRYRWTGHAGIMGNHIQSWHNRNEVLHLFSRQHKVARDRYRRFIEEGISSVDVGNLSGGGLVRSYGGWDSVKLLRKEHEVRIGDERILGDSDFVERALQKDDLKLNKKTSLQQDGWDLEKLVKTVCDYFEIEQTDLTRKGRQNTVSIVKSLICYWGTQVLGLSSTDIATYLGISQPAISKAGKRGAEYSLQHGLFLEALIKI